MKTSGVNWVGGVGLGNGSTLAKPKLYVGKPKPNPTQMNSNMLSPNPAQIINYLPECNWVELG